MDDPKISGEHFSIIVQGNTFYIQESNSINMTWVKACIADKGIIKVTRRQMGMQWIWSVNGIDI